MQNEQGNNPMRQRLRPFAGILLLVAMTAAAYRPAMTAGFVWDDDTHVGVANVRTLGGIVKTWLDPRANQDYYPGSYTSWAIDYQLWGLDPLGYHLENILLHALNALLVWRILRRLAFFSLSFASISICRRSSSGHFADVRQCSSTRSR